MRVLASPVLVPLLALAVAQTPAWAAPPDVPKALTAKPGQLVRVTVKTDAEIGFLRDFSDEEGFFEELATKKGERRFVFQAPDDAEPGKTFVVGWWTDGEKEGVATKITIAGKVKPKPNPVDPDPTDPVVPTAGKVIVVVVEETSQRTPAQGKVLADKGFRDWIKAGGHQFEIVEASDPVTAKNGYAPHAERVGLPAVLVFDAAATGASKPLSVFKLPDSASALQAKVKEVVK